MSKQEGFSVVRYVSDRGLELIGIGASPAMVDREDHRYFCSESCLETNITKRGMLRRYIRKPKEKA